jgi:hypothetical protein
MAFTKRRCREARKFGRRTRLAAVLGWLGKGRDCAGKAGFRPGGGKGETLGLPRLICGTANFRASTDSATRCTDRGTRRYLRQRGAPPGRFFIMRSSSGECIWTVARAYRGHRIKVVQLGDIWHAMVHGHTGSIVKSIESTSLADAMAQAEWFIETRLAFQPPSRYERMAG